MTWLTWRQHRLEVAIMGLAVGAVAALLLVFGLQARALFPDGIEACFATESCTEAWSRLDDQSGLVKDSLVFLNLAPFVIGAFLGAPMLTREFESGTWQLAWTQAVPRMRWLAVKLITLGAATVLMTAALSVATGYFQAPENALTSRFEDGFNLEGVAPVGYAFFAFAAGAAAGIVLRRGLAAIAAAFAAFLLVRIPVGLFLRPGYLPPEKLTTVLTPGEEVHSARFAQKADVGPPDWVLEIGYADAAGRTISDSRFDQLHASATRAGADPATYLHEQGIRRYALYHPSDRFWTFQYIETAIFVALGAVLIGYVVWRIRRGRV
jgi:hypothetical protein